MFKQSAVRAVNELYAAVSGTADHLTKFHIEATTLGAETLQMLRNGFAENAAAETERFNTLMTASVTLERNQHELMTNLQQRTTALASAQLEATCWPPLVGSGSAAGGVGAAWILGLLQAAITSAPPARYAAAPT
jgi:hypothetical protein